jgi:hypothetical protein
VQVDHRDLVREQVVQVTGDPQPFLGHPPQRLGFLGLLGPPGPLGDAVDVGHV